MRKRQGSRRARAKAAAFVSIVVALVGVAAICDLTERHRVGGVTMLAPTAQPAGREADRGRGESTPVALAPVASPEAAPAAMETGDADADVLKVVRDESGERIVAGELLVSYDRVALSDAGMTLDDAMGAMAALGFETLDVIVSDVAAGDAVTLDPLVTYAVPDGMLVSEAADLAGRQACVAYAEPNYVYSVDGAPLPAGTAAASAAPSLAASLSPLAVASASGEALTTVNDPAASSSTARSGIAGAVYGRANQWWLFDESLETSPSYRSTLTANGWDTTYRGSNVIGAWDYARSNGNVTVAIIDTGARLGHEDLAANVISSLAYDAYNSTSTHAIMLQDERAAVQDEFGHGTHVAGIVAGVANNGVGLAGSSYNARIIPIRAGDSRGNLSMSAITRSFSWVVNSCANKAAAGNVRVVNCSFGTYASMASSRTMLDWISVLSSRGILTVCAGGNGKNGVALTSASYPSDYADAFSVTSLEFDGTNSAWSDYNRNKDISAPGEYIYSTLMSGGYGVMSGTSMATPLVSGLAALCWSYDPSLSVSDVRRAITESADAITDTTYNRRSSSGSAGAVNALEMIKWVARRAGGFTISADADTVRVGETLHMRANLKTEATVDWSWSSSDTGVASFSAPGALVGKAAGTVEVTATASIGGETVELDRLAVTVVPAAVDEGPSSPEETQLDELVAPGAVLATSDQVDQVSVSWDASPSKGVSGYRVWRAPQGSADFVAIADVPSTARSYADTTAGPATSYDYAVSAVAQAGESARSAVASGYALTDLSSARIGAVATVTYTGTAHEPRPSVTLGNVSLVAGTDFTYSWANNVNAAQASASAAPRVRVTGIGYYTGSAFATFTIEKMAQGLTFSRATVSKTYGDGAFQTAVTRSGGDGAITYSSSDPFVAFVSAETGRVSIAGSGVTTITATASATANCLAGSASYRLVVGKATLTATYVGGTAEVGATLPTAVAVTGFVNGDTAATAAGYRAPTVNTSAATAAGTYTLTPAGGAAQDYVFVYRAGTLTLTAPKGGAGNTQPEKNVKVLAYRMYDAATRESIYVATIAERNMLKQLGWRYSGLYLVSASLVQDLSDFQSWSVDLFGPSGLLGLFGGLFL